MEKVKNSREWIYVMDHCEALFKIFEKGKQGEFYNIGSNKNLTNIEICKALLEISKNKIKLASNIKINFVKDRPGHDLRYALNSNKIKNKLKWIPKTAFKKGLEQTFKWYLENKMYYKSLSKKDIVKVGIGPGSVCTTRIQTGVGYPQLSAVMECADAAHGLGAHIIADGGCTCPGDVAKGFGGGADFVMLGGMLAGHDEGKGKIVKTNGKKYIEFYGSSSTTANNKHYGGLSDYRSSEGKVVKVKYRGKIKDTVSNILGGVRSSCTYVGAPSLKQLSKCTTFVRVSNQFNDTFPK